MRAMILAAGRGMRMRPLTDHRPKPLLVAGGQPLIVWHIQRLVRAGFDEIVINHAWLGEQIVATLGDGAAYGAHLHYYAESPALETAGGIAHALPFFQGQPFLVVNADIWCDWDPGQAEQIGRALCKEYAAYLVLVDNPSHHRAGDFVLRPHGQVGLPAPLEPTLTFSGIAIYHPSLFVQTPPDTPAPLAPVLRDAIEAQRVRGSHHSGCWMDVGTPERLAHLDACLRIQQASGHEAPT